MARVLAMALLGGVSGLAGVLLAGPLGLGPLGPSVFLGLLIAAYLWTKEVWWMPRLGGVVAASIGGAVVAGFIGVISGFVLGIFLPLSAPASIHSLASAPGGLVHAGLLSSVTLTSWPKAQSGVMCRIGGCAITGAFLSVVGALVAAPMLWTVEPIVAAVIWQGGMAMVLALAAEQQTPAAPRVAPVMDQLHEA